MKRDKKNDGSCGVELKIVRVKNGLLVLKKCEIVDDKKVPIEHNLSGHKLFRHSGKGRAGVAGALSIAQMTYIAKRYHLDGDRDSFAQKMLHNVSIPSSALQHAEYDTFKRSIYDFYNRNSHYCQALPENEAMKTDLLLEILELLRADPNSRDGTAAPKGKSGHKYYESDAWKKYLWKFIYVAKHDFNVSTGQFTKITFCVTDIAKRCKAAALMFPDGQVQLETDYLGIGGPYVFGHAGVSDFNHKYWLLVFQIALSENEGAVYEMLDLAVHFAENVHLLPLEEDEELLTPATVTQVLADGGEAIRAAVEKLSDERCEGDDANQFAILIRRCFAHIIRMGFTRGGGYRGGKGSLPRYLLKQGVPPKVMTKMMSLIIMFNYIPDDDVFEEAMKLFCKEFADHINNHVKENYLSPTDPKKLGGRAAGEQGQPGSNQGGERAGRDWKKTWKTIAKEHKKDKHNFIHLIEAVAHACFVTKKGETGTKKVVFAKEPPLTDKDYEEIADLATWNYKATSICVDWLYFICLDGKGEVVRAKDVIGNSRASFTVWIPTSILYTVLKRLKKSDNVLKNTQPMTVKRHGVVGLPMDFDFESNDANDWHPILVSLNDRERVQLKKDLIQALKDHTVTPKPEENTWLYLQRLAQRRPQHDVSLLVNSQYKPKSAKTLKEEWEKRNEKAKWSNTTEEKEVSSNEGKSRAKSTKNKQEKKKSKAEQTAVLDAEAMLQAWESDDINFDIDEDESMEGLMNILNIFHSELFDENEIETLRRVRRSERVSHKRQLGDWITLKVNAITKKVKCNCDRCNTNGKCEYVVLFEAFQFKKVPSIQHLNAVDTLAWDNKVNKAVENIGIANIHV
jgi:hypothetical protein